MGRSRRLINNADRLGNHFIDGLGDGSCCVSRSFSGGAVGSTFIDNRRGGKLHKLQPEIHTGENVVINSDPTTDYRPREAILLVAGIGRRLRPLTRECPKCLLEVGGMPLLRRLLEQLQQADIERVILATGFQHDLLVAEVDSWSLSLTIDVAANEDYANTNNAVSLAVAMQRLRSPRFLLCDGDILLRRTDSLIRLLEMPRDNILSVMRLDALGKEEMKAVVEPGDGRIRQLGKALSPKRADGESLGIQKIGPSAYHRLKDRLAELDGEEREKLYYEDVFAELIAEGIDFYACSFPVGGWTEIDTVEDLEEARRLATRWEFLPVE